jgi:uncharacterized protein YkwD
MIMRSLRKLLVMATLFALVITICGACVSSEYALSTTCSPEAGGSVTPSRGTYDKDAEVTVTATPAPGYRFDHWEGSVSGQSPTVHLLMDGSKNLKACFTQLQETQEDNREEARITREQKIFNLVNEARADAGLPPLMRVNTIDALALEHSKYMADTNNLSHQGFDARADQLMLVLGSSYVGENVAMGYDSSESFVEGWLDSPGHRQNIMNPLFGRTGIGYSDSYATQIFCD